jgi:hypothetical protein
LLTQPSANLKSPTIRVLRASGPALTAGVEKHRIEGVIVQMTNPAKTVADCFRYRDTVNADVVGASVRGGIRATVTATLEKAIIPLQVDVGFGDAITPAAEDREYPVLVGMAAPKLRMYPVETVIAEKLEAAVKLGIVNSRMQDFYDLLVIFRRFRDDDGTLARAIRDTFARRGTPLP